MEYCIVFATVLIVSVTAVTAGTDTEGSDWVFPPDYYVPNLPESCVNSTICETKCSKYPQALMDEIVTRENLERFSIEETVIGNRASFDELEESTLCTSNTASLVIFEAQNQDGEWRYIVQSSARKYQQILVTSVCSTPKGACGSIAVFPPSVTPRCEQQYVDHLLFSLGPGGELMRDSFRVPSCCVCTFSYKE